MLCGFDPVLYFPVAPIIFLAGETVQCSDLGTSTGVSLDPYNYLGSRLSCFYSLSRLCCSYLSSALGLKAVSCPAMPVLGHLLKISFASRKHPSKLSASLGCVRSKRRCPVGHGAGLQSPVLTFCGQGVTRRHTVGYRSIQLRIGQKQARFVMRYIAFAFLVPGGC